MYDEKWWKEQDRKQKDITRKFSRGNIVIFTIMLVGFPLRFIGYTFAGNCLIAIGLVFVFWLFIFAFTNLFNSLND